MTGLEAGVVAAGVLLIRLVHAEAGRVLIGQLQLSLVAFALALVLSVHAAFLDTLAKIGSKVVRRVEHLTALASRAILALDV